MYIYLFCAVSGGATFLVLFLLSLIGFGHGHDMHGHAGMGDHGGHGGHGGHDNSSSNDFFKLFSVRSVTAAIAAFGLAGMGGYEGHMSEWMTLLFATGSGFIALWFTSVLMNSVTKLDSDGTQQTEKALNATGTVYLTVPAAKSGEGRVTVMQQSRTIEYRALTSGAELPTGAKIKVIKIVTSDTVEVEPV